MTDNILDAIGPDGPPDEDQPVRLPTLPPNPACLLDLPGKLGAVQDFIFNRMTYPDRALAGFATFATMAPFAQTNATIRSRDGLGFNEFYMVLAPTGFGKEDLRRPIEVLDDLSAELYQENPSSGGNLAGVCPPASPQLSHAAPSSAQGCHQLLEHNPSLVLISDEVAEWIKTTIKPGSHTQMTLGYLMQAYNRANGTIHPGNAVTNQYEPVRRPRVSILATSTAEAMLATMTRQQADSGAYNRFVMLTAEQELPAKRYEGLTYEPRPEVIEFALSLKTLAKDTQIQFSRDGWQAFKKLDDGMAEPIKRRDPLLGGRLSEQAIKMAALIALAHDRRAMEPQDLITAFDIRIGIYERTAALAEHDGTLDDTHETGAAERQLVGAFKRHQGIYQSRLELYSRKFKRLPTYARKQVIEYLINCGVCKRDEVKPAWLKSLIYDPEAK